MEATGVNLDQRNTNAEVVNILISNGLRLPNEYMEMVVDKLRGVTFLVKSDEDLMIMDVTDCCRVGPITNEKFCPECGKKIKR